MCSINLILDPSRQEETLKSSIRAMNKVSSHRGPDSSTDLVLDSIALGFNRLEIVGGKRGRQPISNEDHTLFLVCNGEIFNYKNLRNRYLKKHRFVTTSDTEVILHLYEEFGVNFLSKLEGQFAFILVDKKNNKIIMARDPFGILPLYYFQGESKLIVSSTIKSIFASMLVIPKINVKGLAETWFFYGPRSPNTCFDKVLQLSPGSVGVYDVHTKKNKITKYWNFPTIVNNSRNKKKLKVLLEESIKRRVQGSYRPGVYISGGLDSAIIAYLVKRISRLRPIFFGIKFENESLDESFYQKLLSEYLNCKLVLITAKNQIIVKNIKDCVMQAETSLIRTAPIPMMLLSKIVRKRKLKFILCGEGADELFMGYPVFLKNRSSFEDKWLENLKYLKVFKNSHIKAYIKGQFLTLVKTKSLRKKEIDTKLSNYLLSTQGDRVSMANGIEQRFPYLDLNVVNFALNIPEKFLLKDVRTKEILRKEFRNSLPEIIVNRVKQGYLAPDVEVVSLILKSTGLKRFISLETTKSAGIFSYKEILDLVKRIDGGEVSESLSRFLLFVLTSHMLKYYFVDQA